MTASLKPTWEALGSKRLDNGVPALLECLDAFAELLVLAVARLLFCRLGGGRRGDRVARSELPVLFFELSDSLLENMELDLASVARVLRGDAVAVCAGFLALF